MNYKRLTVLPTLAILASISFAGGPTSRAAEQILTRVGLKIKSLKGYRFDAVETRTFDSGRTQKTTTNTNAVVLTFERPNLFDFTNRESNFPEPVRYLSDGKTVYTVARGKYYQEPIQRDAEDFHWDHDDLFLYLLTGSFEKAIEAPFHPTYSMLPDEQFDGQTCKVIDAEVGGGLPISYKIYIGPDDIPRRITHVEAGDRPFTLDFTISKFEPNPSAKPADFVFHPTPDLKPGVRLNSGEQPLIAIGEQAPDFSLPTPAGGRVSLYKALDGKKALLLNFWFVHCPPCRAEHPKLQKFCEDLADQGLGLLAVDDQDSSADVAKYMKAAGLHFQTVLSGPRYAVDPKTGYPGYQGPKLPDYKSLEPFGIHWCPTNILLDANGKVVYESDKWDEEGLRKALAQLGVQ